MTVVKRFLDRGEAELEGGCCGVKWRARWANVGISREVHQWSPDGFDDIIYVYKEQDPLRSDMKLCAVVEVACKPFDATSRLTNVGESAIKRLGQINKCSFADLFIVHGPNEVIRDFQGCYDSTMPSPEHWLQIWQDVVSQWSGSAVWEPISLKP